MSRDQNLYNLTNQELTEALVLYQSKVAEDIIAAMKQEYGFSDEVLDLVKPLLVEASRRSFIEGLDTAKFPSNPITYYLDHMKSQSQVQSRCKQYDFEPNKGICGILTPDAQFFKCGDKEHYILVEENSELLPWTVQHQCVYFSSTLRSSDDGVISFSPRNEDKNTTQAQRDWMTNNVQYFDYMQQDMYRIYFIDALKTE